MRGYQKRVVFLKNPGGDIFEEAYFILKSNGDEPASDEIVSEAYRIINANKKEMIRKSHTPRLYSKALFFGAGFFFCMLIFITASLLV